MPRLLLILPLALLLASCTSDDDPTGPESGSEALRASPTSGAPGTVVVLSGPDLDEIDPSTLEVRFDGVISPLRLSDGVVAATVPLIVDGTGALVVNTGPVDLELLADGAALGRVEFVLEEAVAAEGAADSLARDLARLVDGLAGFAPLQPELPSVQAGGLQSWFGALDSLLTGDHELSLAHNLEALEDASPAVRAAVDAMIESSGLREQTALLAQVAEQLGTTAERARLDRRITELGDEDLAARMQLHALVQAFGSDVINATAQTWSNTMGLLAGAIGLVQSVPGAGQIGAILSVADFAVNKVAVAYLPAKIESFTLDVPATSVNAGALVASEMTLVAVNDPPPIGIQDLISLALTGLGTLNDTQRETFRDFLLNTADWYLGIVRTLLGAYDTAHPEIQLDVDVASIPVMRWQARVVTPELVERATFTPELIAADDGSATWRAVEDVDGEARIYARPAIGPDALRIPLPPGFEYNAGSFGNDIVATETETIFVVQPIFVRTSMASSITPDGTNGLEVRVGRSTAAGDTVWLEQVLVECTATGGTVDPASGVTGADGRFDTFVSLDEGSTVVVVDVVATGDFDQQATASVSAASGDLLVLELEGPDGMLPGESRRVDVRTYYTDPGGEFLRDAEEEVTLSYSVTGGTVSRDSDTADEGYNSVEVTLDFGSPEVVLTATAFSDSGQVADATKTLVSLAEDPIMITRNYFRVWYQIGGFGASTYYWDSGSQQTGDQALPYSEDLGRRIDSGDDQGAYSVACSLTADIAFTRSADDVVSGMTARGRVRSIGESSGGYGLAHGQVQMNIDITVYEGTWILDIDGEIEGGPGDPDEFKSNAGSRYLRRNSDFSTAVLLDSGDGELVPIADTATLGPGTHRLLLGCIAEGATDNRAEEPPFDRSARFAVEASLTRQ